MRIKWKWAEYKNMFLFLAERSLKSRLHQEHCMLQTWRKGQLRVWNCHSLTQYYETWVLQFNWIWNHSNSVIQKCPVSVGFALAWYVNCARWDLCSHAVFVFFEFAQSIYVALCGAVPFLAWKSSFWPLAHGLRIARLAPGENYALGIIGVKTSIVCRFERVQLNRKQFFRCRPASSKREAGLGRRGWIGVSRCIQSCYFQIKRELMSK